MSFLPPAFHGSKIRGVWLAIVVDNKDGEGHPGYRVKLKFPWLAEQDTSFWARIAVPMGGSGRGTYVLPEIDDQVLVVFEHGDINRPIVVGALWSKQQEPVEANQSGKNNTKLIKSRCGHRIIFDDKQGAEKIIIVDKTKKNKLVLDSVNKIIKIESDGDVEVIAKTNVVMHANALKVGAKQSITGTAQSLLSHAQKTFGLKATSGITIGGGNTTINTSNAAATSVSGSGAGEVGGIAEEQPKDQVQAGQHNARSAGSPGDARGAGSRDQDRRDDDPGAPAEAPRLEAPQEYQLECALITTGGKPRPGVRFDITLPDGGAKNGTSGRDGVIRLSALTTPGQARLVLPDIDARISDHWPGAGGIPYAKGGVSIPVGTSQVSLPPAAYRGRIIGLHFETDKTFLLPAAVPGIRVLKRFYDEHPGASVLVVGHADRQGNESYNLSLSEKRAAALADFLRDRVDAWLAWYQPGQAVAQPWGTREDQHMLSALADGAGAFYTGEPSGRIDAPTRAGLARFQQQRNLTEGTSLRTDGQIDAATRRQLVTAYLQQDGTTLTGVEPVTHGCGEWHPVVATVDGAAENENRRSEIYFFEGDVTPAPVRCRAPGCREYDQWVRAVIEEIDVETAPDPETEVTVTVLDELGLPFTNARVTVDHGDGRRMSLTSDSEGKIRTRVQQGEQYTVEIADIHEATEGIGVTTGSGRHLREDGT
jgi:outer membrane protein OmpA-like peptidoglycan-associated protein